MNRRYPFLILLGILLATQLPAQTPPATPPATTPLDGGTLLLADAGLDVIIPLLEDLTGQNVIIPQALPAVRFNFQPTHPMSREEQLVALESLLAINGLSVIEVNPRLIKIVPSAQAALNAPQLIPGPLADLPGSERIVSKLFQLNYVTTEEAVTVIQPLLSQASAIQEPRQDWLLLTDQLTHLKRVESLLAQIDQPSGRAEEVRFFDLQFAPAESVGERITNLAEGALANRLGGRFNLSVDERSNRIIIVSHPDNFPLITDLVSKLDVDAAPITRSEVFYIKHATAEEIVSVLETVITGQQQAAEESETNTPATQRGRGENPVTPPTPPTPNPTATPNATANAAATGASLQFSEFVTLASDERANAIVVYGTDSDIRQIGDLIGKIDILLSQVRLEVVITEVTLNEGMVRGLDAFGLAYNLEDSNEIELSPDGPPLRVGGILVNALTIQDFSIDAIFNTAKSNGNVSVLSSPTILTTHNQEATINVSQDIPIVTGTVTSDEGTSTRSTIDRIEVGVQLVVKPLVAPDGVIQMEIKQTVDNIVSVISDSNNPDLNGQPIIGTREAESFVSVRDNAIIVLGGLQETSETFSENRLALFGHIPWLGEALFTRKERDIVTRELVIFIKPTVLFNADDAAIDARSVLEKLENTEDVERFIETGHMRPHPLDRIEDWKPQTEQPDPTEYRPAPVEDRTLPRRPRK